MLALPADVGLDLWRRPLFSASAAAGGVRSANAARGPCLPGPCGPAVELQQCVVCAAGPERNVVPWAHYGKSQQHAKIQAHPAPEKAWSRKGHPA